MQTTIDKAGRVVIPKQVRDELGLRGGEEVDVRTWNGAIEIRRSPREVLIVRGENGLVHADFGEDGPSYGPEEVREILERTRRREL